RNIIVDEQQHTAHSFAYRGIPGPLCIRLSLMQICYLSIVDQLIQKLLRSRLMLLTLINYQDLSRSWFLIDQASQRVAQAFLSIVSDHDNRNVNYIAVTNHALRATNRRLQPQSSFFSTIIAKRRKDPFGSQP